MSVVVEIPGKPGYYARDDGTIWTRRRGAYRPLRSRVDKGYLRINLSVDGCKASYYVHRLVALAFHGVPPAGTAVCHLNHDPRDNRPENLMYGTQAENVAQTVAAGRHVYGERHHSARLGTGDAAIIRARLASGERQVAIAGDYGISQAAVSDIKREVTWPSLREER